MALLANATTAARNLLFPGCVTPNLGSHGRSESSSFAVGACWCRLQSGNTRPASHLVALASQMVTEVRRRVTRDQLGRPGTTVDPGGAG
jgi:hypothetical protein